MSVADPPPAGPRHPSALALHEYQLALLGPREAESVGRHLSLCQLCRTDLSSLAGDQRRFEREVFPQTREAIVRRRSPWRWWFALPSLAAAAAAWLLIAPLRRGPELLPKGDSMLAVFVASGEGPLPVTDGQTRLHPGDRIRFVLRPVGQRYAVIASLDGTGRATVYHPFGGRESAALPPGPRFEVPGSIVLDDSPGPERVFAVLAARPFPTALVLDALQTLARRGSIALRTTARLPLALEATQQSLLFEKSP
jgi:hypothetical protein